MADTKKGTGKEVVAHEPKEPSRYEQIEEAYRNQQEQENETVGNHPKSEEQIFIEERFYPNQRVTTESTLRHEGPSFGNIEFPKYFNYIAVPTGISKFIKVMNNVNPHDLWELLTIQWKYYKPNLVISLEGPHGPCSIKEPCKNKEELDAIVKAAVKMKTWVLTDGLDDGITLCFAKAVQQFLEKRTEDVLDLHNFPLLAFTPWSSVKENETLSGIHLGPKKVIYVQTKKNDLQQDDKYLNPYHTAYILAFEETTSTLSDPGKGDAQTQIIPEKKEEKNIKMHNDRLKKKRKSENETNGPEKTDAKKDKQTQNVLNVFPIRERFLKYVSEKADLGYFSDYFERCRDPRETTTAIPLPNLKTPVVSIAVNRSSGDLKLELRNNGELSSWVYGATDKTKMDLDENIILALLKGSEIRGNNNLYDQFCITLAFDRPELAKEEILDGHRKELLSWKEDPAELERIFIQTHFKQRLLADPRSKKKTDDCNSFGNLWPLEYSFNKHNAQAKYIRLDDESQPEDIWQLLTDFWNIPKPILVISVNDGAMPLTKLHTQQLESILNESAKTKDVWIMTDGLNCGVTKAMAAYMKEKSRDVYIIGFTPWSIVANKKTLSDIYLRGEKAFDERTRDQKPNALAPFHHAFILCDDGTDGRYIKKPRVRVAFEEYIRSNSIATPFISIIVGGDNHTDENVVKAIEDEILVIVISNGPKEEQYFNVLSQEFVNKIALVSKEGMSKEFARKVPIINRIDKERSDSGTNTDPKDKDIQCGSVNTTAPLKQYITKYDHKKKYVSDMLKNRGPPPGTANGQPKKEKNSPRNSRTDMLQIAILTGREHFVKLLLDFDQDGNIKDFDHFVTLDRLRLLYSNIFLKDDVQVRLLRRLVRQKKDGGFLLGEEQILPQMGRVIHILMGNHYRLLYQEEEFGLPCWNTIEMGNEEALWHMFFWAILSNQRDLAEAFLFHTSCKVGAALVGFKMFSRLSWKAERRGEIEHSTELAANAAYFEKLAVHVIDKLYNENRDQAYASLVSKLPFDWARFVTPLTIAEEAGAQTFMNHASVQTLLDRIWHNYMDPNVAWWKLLLPWIPIFFLWIVFDPRLLAYGSFRKSLEPHINHVEKMDSKVPARSKNNKVGAQANSAKRRENPHSTHRSETIGVDFLGGSTSDQQKRGKKEVGRIGFKLWSLQMFLTAPVTKFTLHLWSYGVFLVALTHFILTVMAPISGPADVSWLEWFIMIYVAGLIIDDFVQLLFRRSSGPLYKVEKEKTSNWNILWNPMDRLSFFIRAYKLSHWLSEIWNRVDVFMHITYITAVILRFTVESSKFSVVRLTYVVSMLIFYFRILRYLSVWFYIGPRLVTIGRMILDLFKFMLILSVFIVSFGIAFQALLDPNQPPGFAESVGILWRPYWQLYDTLYLEDVMDDAGHRIKLPRNCTYILSSPGVPFCDHWIMPLLIAVYKVISIIILLNLLIAIFSHSFNVTEEQAVTIWRWQLGELTREYYYQVWLPPPLNIICHIANGVLWLNRDNNIDPENHLFQRVDRRTRFEERKHKKWIRSKLTTQDEKMDQMINRTEEMDKNITWITKHLNLRAHVSYDNSRHSYFQNYAAPTTARQINSSSVQGTTVQRQLKETEPRVITQPKSILRSKESTDVPDSLTSNTLQEPNSDETGGSKGQPMKAKFPPGTMNNGRISTMLSSTEIEYIRGPRVQVPPHVRKLGGTI